MRRPDPTSQRGAALVEFALVLPILVVLVMGIIDYGRLATTRIALHEAVQEGSIYAATHPDDATGIRTRTVTGVDNPTIDPTKIVIDCPATGQLRIRIEHPMDLITPLFGASLTLDAEVTTDVLTESASCVQDPPPPPGP